MQSNYGLGKVVDCSFEVAIEKVTAALQKEGFGVLSDIDVAATMKKKLNIEMPAYRILGACNPPFAHQALEIEPRIGLFLPCNVVVRIDNVGAVHVECINPQAFLNFIEDPQMNELALAIKERLERVIASL